MKLSRHLMLRYVVELRDSTNDCTLIQILLPKLKNHELTYSASKIFIRRFFPDPIFIEIPLRKLTQLL